VKAAKPRILVVEDLKVAQKAALLAIEPFNCDVDIAETGTQAINLFKRQHYDMVFMDIGLPDMHGLTVVERIREAEEGSQTRVPIIALTAHTTDEYQQASFDYGMDEFLSKPLKSDKVGEMIKKYIKQG
jgi:CheY-like chemotaxis protein